MYVVVFLFPDMLSWLAQGKLYLLCLDGKKCFQTSWARLVKVTNKFLIFFGNFVLVSLVVQSDSSEGIWCIHLHVDECCLIPISSQTCPAHNSW